MEERRENMTGFHSFAASKNASIFSPVFFLIIAIVVVLGMGIGFFFAQNKSSATTMISNSATGSVEKGKIYGSSDTQAFKDTTEGVLQKGGIEDEGQYHLVRAGGNSQNVYLTSSSVDLSQFINKKVRVHGATQSAKHAGWLMDVGQVEVLE